MATAASAAADVDVAAALRAAAAARVATTPVLPVQADLTRVVRGTARIQVADEPPPRIRLTVRGRRVVMALIVISVLVAIALAWLAGAASAHAAAIGPQDSQPGLVSVVVQPGDTLWSVAARADPSADPRAVVQEMVSLNGLRGVTLQPGQWLRVPTG